MNYVIWIDREESCVHCIAGALTIHVGIRLFKLEDEEGGTSI
jgi:hypothetical protein